MKFSSHEISLFTLKVQRILNKFRVGTSESELETSLCHCLAPLGLVFIVSSHNQIPDKHRQGGFCSIIADNVRFRGNL